MSSKERREREKREQRQRILDAAQHIIAREGFSALSMRKLAERIEYSPASIYLHFKNREEIARVLAEAGYGQLLEHILQAVASPSDPIPRAIALAEAYVRFALEHPETYRLIFMGDSAYFSAAFAEQRQDSAAQRAWNVILATAAGLKAASRAHRRRKTEDIAQALWATLHGIVSLHLTCPGFQIASPEALARLSTEWMATGLLAPKS